MSQNSETAAMLVTQTNPRGGEWYLEKRGSRKILAGSRNLGSVSDKSRSLVFSWFVFTFCESRNVSPKSLGLGFLIRISASRRVSDFTICHPFKLRSCELSIIQYQSPCVITQRTAVFSILSMFSKKLFLITFLKFTSILKFVVLMARLLTWGKKQIS